MSVYNRKCGGKKMGMLRLVVAQGGEQWQQRERQGKTCSGNSGVPNTEMTVTEGSPARKQCTKINIVQIKTNKGCTWLVHGECTLTSTGESEESKRGVDERLERRARE
jgi:hypothetical protein